MNQVLTVSVIGSFCLLATAGLSYLLILAAPKIGMLDKPNVRSSHSYPTPKGGGLAFCFVFFVTTGLLYCFREEYRAILFPLFVGAPVVTALGWFDDRSSLPAWLRLLVHLIVAISVYALITDNFSIQVHISFLPKSAWLTTIFCVLFITWSINLYNFMDGADGLAASTGFVGTTLMAAVAYFNNSPSVAMVYLIMGYCLAGFLVFNWSPAKIFMGDTGSYFIGFVFSSLALITKLHSSVSIYSYLIIFGFFIFDATYTLFRRALRRERVFEAHRMFLFHKLLVRGWSHSSVAILYSAVIVIWLFPLSNLAAMYEDSGILLVILAYSPLFIGAILMKAGEPEQLT
jgi:Fuc2NAc and GlcNAc transferase